MRTHPVALALALLLCATLAPRSAGADRASTFAEANAAYQDGRFEEAATAYEALVGAGILNEDLFYNLGNAYFRAGKLGPAIYNYERALVLAPGFADARYNLEVAREEVAERVVDRLEAAETDPLWIRAVTFFTIGQLTIGFIVFNLAFFGVLTALRFLATGFARTSLLVTAGFAGVALAASIVLLAGHIYYTERVDVGVVLADQVHMREGPDDQLAERGQLHPGLRVRILGQEHGWVRIRLSNGVEGWVPAEAVGEL